MRDLRRKLLSLGNHFFERLKTANFSTACGTVTLKSPPSRGSDAPHVHPRLRKRPPRCTLDCGFKTSESPALRGFVGGPGRKRHRAFILCFYRTGRFPAQFPIGGAKAGANSADACLGYRDATLATKAAHSGSQGRTRRLHLHLRSLCLFLVKLLGILAQAHAGLLLAKRIHLAQ